MNGNTITETSKAGQVKPKDCGFYCGDLPEPDCAWSDDHQCPHGLIRGA